MSKKKKRSPKKPSTKLDAISPREDLRLWVLSVTSILLAWGLILRKWPDFLLIKGDIQLQLPRYMDFLSRAPWTNSVYRLDTLGGVHVADSLGKLPIFDFLGYVGWPAVLSLNIVLILTQSLFAYFGCHFVQNLVSHWRQENYKLNASETIGLGFLIAFIPAFGARLDSGHLDLLLGLSSYVILLSLLMGLLRQRLSAFHLVITFLSLWHIIPSQGHQMKLYSLVFGFPVLVCLFLSLQQESYKTWWAKRKIELLATGLTLMASLMAAWPRFSGMLEQATSSNSPRSIGGEAVIYSYTGTQWYNYLASFFWDYKLLAETNDTLLRTVYYFPMGVFLLALFFLRGRNKFLTLGLILSFALSVGLALQVPGIKELLLGLIPPLSSFRVPERSLLVFCLSLPLIAGALIIQKNKDNSNSWNPIFLLACALIAGLLSGFVRESLWWALALVAFASPAALKKRVSSGALLLGLGFGSLAATTQWMSPFKSHTKEVAHFKSLGDEVRKQLPELNQPLYRSFLNFQNPSFNVNVSQLMGISSVSGYWFPTSRFLSLLGELQKTRFPSTAVYFNIEKSHPGVSELRSLYNICCEINVEKGLAPTAHRTQPTAGPYWVSQNIRYTASLNSLVLELKQQGENLPRFLQSQVLLDTSDPASQVIKEKGLLKNYSQCQTDQAIELETLPKNHSISLKTAFAQDCPLTLAMNFSTRLSATWTKQGVSQELVVFPAYGALTSVIVPPGKGQLTLSAKTNLGPLNILIGVLGWCLFGFSLWLFRRGHKWT